ncbi:MAG: hypothetical protein GF417_00590, partial [Candidatus Latescibacteria bacterium]|nr:hypothetical protein [bacterium]MBD3422924.1 hypothetical protein [Candidatus Latescibacterota bacterium]
MKQSRLIPGLALGLMLSSLMPAGARGQQLDIAGGISDSTQVRLLSPVWSFRTSSGKLSSAIGSKVSMDINPGNGMIFNSWVDLQKTTYKTREMTDINQSLAILGAKRREGVYSLSLALTDNYRSTQSVSIARFGKDIVNEDKKIAAGFDYLEPLLAAESSKLRVYGEYVEGQHDFKYDEKFTLEASGNLSYKIGDNISLGGGYGKMASTEDSRVSYLYY